MMMYYLFLICCIVAIIAFLKKIKKDKLSANGIYQYTENYIFKWLWALPVAQIVIAGMLLLCAKGGVSLLSDIPNHSSILGSTIQESLGTGIVGSVASEMYEGYRFQEMQKMSPFISELYSLCNWGKYLLYATFASLAIYIFALKERKLPKEILMGINVIITILMAYFIYELHVNITLGFNSAVSAELLGLLGNKRYESMEDAFLFTIFSSLIFSVGLILHYAMLDRYFNNTEKLEQPVRVKAQMPIIDDEEDHLVELMNIKHLYETGILNEEEMKSMKHNILGSNVQKPQSIEVVHGDNGFKENSCGIVSENKTTITNVEKPNPLEDNKIQMYIWGITAVIAIIIIIFALTLA